MATPLDPEKLEALARARAEVLRLEAELGVSGDAGEAPAPAAEAARWWTEVAHLAQDFISVHASNGDYLFASPSCEHLFGWTPEQLRGTNAYTYFHPEDLARITSNHASHTGESGAPRVRYRLRCGDGSWRWVETTSHAQAAGDAVQRIVATTRPVDDQVTLEDKLQESNERLGRFAAVAAHDIKSPLATIAGMSEMLAMTTADRLHPRETRRLEQVHAAALRLGALVDGLLAWAQIEAQPPRREPTDLRRLTDEVLADLQADLERSGAQVAVGELPTVPTDPTMTRVLLQNLIGNAIKHRQPDQQPRVRIAAEEHSGAWRLAVEDDGPGIAPEQQERIFQIYTRVGTPQAPGQGIGLSLCARIAHKQGGRIWVESNPGEGARFVVELPAA